MEILNFLSEVRLSTSLYYSLTCLSNPEANPVNSSFLISPEADHFSQLLLLPPRSKSPSFIV